MKTRNALIIILVLIIALLLFLPKKVNTQTITETKIERLTDTIEVYKDKVVQELKYIYKYEKSIDTVFTTLEIARIEKDTVQIIVVQDSIIKMQGNEIKHLFIVIDYQGDIILGQDTIIAYKDVIIDDLKTSNKKTKRKLRWSIGTNFLQLADRVRLIFK